MRSCLEGGHKQRGGRRSNGTHKTQTGSLELILGVNACEYRLRGGLKCCYVYILLQWGESASIHHGPSHSRSPWFVLLEPWNRAGDPGRSGRNTSFTASSDDFVPFLTVLRFSGPVDQADR